MGDLLEARLSRVWRWTNGSRSSEAIPLGTRAANTQLAIHSFLCAHSPTRDRRTRPRPRPRPRSRSRSLAFSLSRSHALSPSPSTNADSRLFSPRQQLSSSGYGGMRAKPKGVSQNGRWTRGAHTPGTEEEKGSHSPLAMGSHRSCSFTSNS